jgi:hypothetical protein
MSTSDEVVEWIGEPRYDPQGRLTALMAEQHHTLWAVGNALFGTGDARGAAWVEPLKDHLYARGAAPVLALPPGYKLAILYHESAHVLYHQAESVPACLSPTHRRAVEVHADTLTACCLVVQGFDVCSDVWRLRAHGCRPAFLRSRVGPLVQAAAYLLEWTGEEDTQGGRGTPSRAAPQLRRPE